jgi:hypothetical protein
MKKNVSKWGDVEGDLIVEALGDVALVEAARSSGEALQLYVDLGLLLNSFFARRPDVKARVDPDVVVFDIGGGVPPNYLAALQGYIHPGHLSLFPPAGACNVGTVPFCYSMGDNSAANYFIGYMKRAVPGLSALLVSGAPNPPIVY